MYNKIILMGRLTAEPKLTATASGINVCTFRIAVDRRFQSKDDEKKTDFFNIVAWRSTGEFVNKYFSKGSSILVEGELQTREYNDRNGNRATWYEVNAERVSFTGEKKKDNNAAAQAAPPPAAPPPISNDYNSNEYDDDYPF